MFGISMRADTPSATLHHGDATVDVPVHVFLDRSRFEAGVSRMLRSTSVNAEDCAIFYIITRSSDTDLDDADASHNMLNLIGNILRSRVHAGALAYLGNGKFAVMLEDVSARDAVAYARSVFSVLSDIRMQWGGRVLTIDAHIGGAMTEGRQDGESLLELAQLASDVARTQLGYKVHMVHDREEGMLHLQHRLMRMIGSDTQSGNRPLPA
jgi:GGDEF domain-containing protein